MAAKSIPKRVVPVPTSQAAETPTRRNDLLDGLSMQIERALAIADVFCFVNDLESLDQHTLAKLAYLQSDILLAAKKLANSDEVRP